MEKVGFEGVRPYALRHTFATINLARGENIKTISVTVSYTHLVRSTTINDVASIRLGHLRPK